MNMEDGSGIALGIGLVVVLLLAIWGGYHEGYNTACIEALDDPRHFIKSAMKLQPEKALEIQRSESGSVEVR